MTTRAKSPTHFGFLILRRRSVQVLDFRLPEQELRTGSRDSSFICFALPQSQNRKSKIVWPVRKLLPPPASRVYAQPPVCIAPSRADRWSGCTLARRCFRLLRPAQASIFSP